MRSIIFGTNAAVFVRDELAISQVKTDLEQDSTGAVVVNQSMAASSSVFAAGEDANVYTQTMGRGTLSGEGHNYGTAVVAADSIMGEDAEYREVPVLDYSVPSVGVCMTLVGNCSAAFNSYGYWWKEPSRRKPSSGDETQASSSSSAEKPSSYFSGWTATGGVEGKGKKSRKEVVYGNARTTRRSDSSVELSPTGASPVYGDGVLFYLNGDVIMGILINVNIPSNERFKVLERAKQLIGTRVSIGSSTISVWSEQYARYQNLNDTAVDILSELTEFSAAPSRLSSPCFFQYFPASRATIRALNSSTQSLGPSFPPDLSFAESGSSSIAASEATSAAYRKGLVNRTTSFT